MRYYLLVLHTQFLLLGGTSCPGMPPCWNLHHDCRHLPVPSAWPRTAPPQQLERFLDFALTVFVLFTIPSVLRVGSEGVLYSLSSRLKRSALATNCVGATYAFVTFIISIYIDRRHSVGAGGIPSR